MPRILITALFAFWIPWTVSAGTQISPRNTRVMIDMNSQLKDIQLLEAGLDLFAPTPDGWIEGFVTSEELQYLRENLGYDVLVTERDIYAEWEKRHGYLGVGNLSDYRNYDENVALLFETESNYPSIAKVYQIGTSLEGRAIYAMKISDNVAVDEDEPELLYTGIHHSREPVSNEVVCQLIEMYSGDYASDPEIQFLVNNRELWFVPIVNPDGYAYVDNSDPYWRKNRRNGYGVDLNRNYGFKWGYDNIGSSPFTSDQTYRGSSAFSEPETQAIRDLCNAREFVFTLNYHTYGDLYLWGWGYIPSPTPEDEVYQAVGDSLSSDNGYTAGIGSIVLYITNGDADDWMYGEQDTKPRIFAITPEVGPDFWPNRSQIQNLVNENIGPSLYIARQAARPLAVLPPKAPVLHAPASDPDGTFDLWWDNSNNRGYDPPVSYDLRELVGLERGEDDLEDGGTGWSADGGFTIRTNRYHSSTRSFYSGQQDQNVADLEANTAVAIGGREDLTFWTWYDIEDDWDYAYAQISIDGGSSWTNMPGNITTSSNPNGNNQGNGITGNSRGWIQGVFDLEDYMGENALFRFRYVTDQAVLEEGIYVDDIAPVERFDRIEIIADGIADTTFTVTGRSTARYYYEVRATDADNQDSRWSARAEVDVTGSNLVVELDPVATSVPRGGELAYWGTVRNDGNDTEDLDIWADLTLVNGNPYENNPILGPLPRTLAPGAEIRVFVTQDVPNSVPLGTYGYTGSAGDHPNAEASDSFQFTALQSVGPAETGDIDR